MKKDERAPGWFRSRPVITNIIIATVETIIAILLWTVGDFSTVFANIPGYILIWVAVLFASIATVCSIRASVSTRESLQLTRAGTRPFLNVLLTVARDFNRNRAYLWYRHDENPAESHRLQEEKGYPSVIFPGVKAGPTFFAEEEQLDRIKAPGSRVRVTVSYRNKLTNEMLETRRTFRFVNAVGHTTFHQVQAVPVSEEDYWT